MSESVPSRPTVSVVIPCYNQGAYLDDAVSSCLEAYEGPLEIIIVDDGSTDPRTRGYIAALSIPPRAELKVVSQPNGGLARARNVGVARATGEFVQFLDADDLLVRNKLEHQLRHFQLRPDLDVSISDYYLSDATRSEVTGPPSSIARFSLSLEDFLFHWERGLTVPIHAALFRRGALDDASAFVEAHRAKEDWLFWVSLKLKGARLGYLPLRLCVYRLHGTNMTRSSAEMGLAWIKAAAQIERWLEGRYPDFMERSLRWYVDWYLTRSHSDAPPPAAELPVAQPDESTDDEEHAAPARTASPPASRCAISVVVPVFNHARYLRRCILSAHRQTTPPLEIVCVDDGSTDPQVRPILEGLAREIPELKLRLLDENRGISHAQNLAVEAASGEFVAFLDCDDFLAPTALETIARAMQGHPEADYFFTDRYDIDESGRTIRHAVYGGYPNRPDLDGVSHYDNLLDAMVASHLKVIRRSKVLAVGGFDARTSGVQDWDLALRIAERDNLHYVPAPLYHHRVHRGSVTLGQRTLMFRLTNEVRRRQQVVRSRKQTDATPDAAVLAAVARVAFAAGGEGAGRGSFGWDAGLRAWIDGDLDVAVIHRERAPRECWSLWAAHRAAVFVLERDASQATLAFLREFNSYFDLVVCADEAQWATLHRYMWDSSALRLADELFSARSPRGGVVANSLSFQELPTRGSPRATVANP